MFVLWCTAVSLGKNPVAEVINACCNILSQAVQSKVCLVVSILNIMELVRQNFTSAVLNLWGTKTLEVGQGASQVPFKTLM